MTEQRKYDFLNNAEHVGLEELPRVGMLDGVIQVVDGLLQHAGRDISLLLMLV